MFEQADSHPYVSRPGESCGALLKEEETTMTTDSFFALLCVSVITLFFGFVMAFSGYRFFLILLPIWGFFFGFSLGAQAIQAIFGTAFLSDITSWVVGFIVAAIFAVLSYLFYFMAVALLAGALGYAIGAGLLMAIGFDMGFITWMSGIIVGLIFAVGVLVLNIQKWVIVGATSLLGAGVIVGTFLFLFGALPPQQLVANPVAVALRTSPLWMITYLLVAMFGIFVQFQTTRRWDIESYNRWEEMDAVPQA
jgi:hypothetical protein